MLPLDPLTVMSFAAMLIGGIVWLVRLEGRINVSDARYGEITSRLIRIENKLDRGHVDI